MNSGRGGVGRAPSPLRNRLAQLSGSASKLLETKIDAISTVDLESGRQEAKAEKKALTIRADELLTRLHALIDFFVDLPVLLTTKQYNYPHLADQTQHIMMRKVLC